MSNALLDNMPAFLNRQGEIPRARNKRPPKPTKFKPTKGLRAATKQAAEAREERAIAVKIVEAVTAGCDTFNTITKATKYHPTVLHKVMRHELKAGRLKKTGRRWRNR